MSSQLTPMEVAPVILEPCRLHGQPSSHGEDRDRAIVDGDTHEFSSVRREVGFEALSSYSYRGRRLGASFRLYTVSLGLTTMTTVPEIPHHVPAPPSKEECTRLLLTHYSDS